MRAIVNEGAGGAEVLRLVDRDVPQAADGQVLIRVIAAGLNRPDIQQRKGLYPAPPGASDIAGLEVAGIVEAAGPEVAWPRPGDPVCALVTAGAHAECCVAPALQCLPVPAGLSFRQAAVLPEVMFTTWNSMVLLGRLMAGETVLIQGGASGVGLAATQVANKLFDAKVIATAGSGDKLDACRRHGARHAISYHEDWPAAVLDVTQGKGVDLALDGQAGRNIERTLAVLAFDGRLVLLASHDNEMSEVNTRKIVRRGLTLMGTTIRPRSPEYKGRIAAALIERVWPLLAARDIDIPICAAFPLEEIAAAHTVLDDNRQVGKVVLELSSEADRTPG